MPCHRRRIDAAAPICITAYALPALLSRLPGAKVTDTLTAGAGSGLFQGELDLIQPLTALRELLSEDTRPGLHHGEPASRHLSAVTNAIARPAAGALKGPAVGTGPQRAGRVLLCFVAKVASNPTAGPAVGTLRGPAAGTAPR